LSIDLVANIIYGHFVRSLPKCLHETPRCGHRRMRQSRMPSSWRFSLDPGQSIKNGDR
jgi:hypothetical protein